MNPLNLIEAIRESFNFSTEVYTRGSCYRFHLILKEVFPNAIAFYNHDHVYTLIGDTYYDITGVCYPDPARCYEITEGMEHEKMMKLMYTDLDFISNRA